MRKAQAAMPEPFHATVSDGQKIEHMFKMILIYRRIYGSMI